MHNYIIKYYFANKDNITEVGLEPATYWLLIQHFITG